jgi:hypothetical protein
MFLALVCVGLLMWGRLLLKEVPRTAIADPKEAVSLKAKSDNEGALDDRPVVRESVQVALASDINRDIFRLNPHRYPQLPKDHDDQSGKPKFPTDLSEEQLELSEIQESLGELKLETTITGRSPLAVINGQAIRPGQNIGGFELVKVKQRSVVLKMHDRQVELEL